MSDSDVGNYRLTKDQAGALWRAAKDWINSSNCSMDGVFEDDLEAAKSVLETTQPRALVALSEDRQWLVVLDCHGRWSIMGKRFGQAAHGFWWTGVVDIEDTGQSAHEVLREFLEGRGEARAT